MAPPSPPGPVAVFWYDGRKRRAMALHEDELDSTEAEMAHAGVEWQLDEEEETSDTEYDEDAGDEDDEGEGDEEELD